MVAHAGTFAMSAAYAPAVAADRVMVTADGAVGSIGVIATVYDRIEGQRRRRPRRARRASGALRPTRTPTSPSPTPASPACAPGDGARAELRRLGRGAPRADPEAVLAHQGATIYAARALETGLADAIGTPRRRHLHRRGARGPAEAHHADRAAARGHRRGPRRGSHEEALATIATMRKRAEAAEATERELAAVREQLAQRDAADAARAREGVLAKHRDRGALTPRWRPTPPSSRTSRRSPRRPRPRAREAPLAPRRR